MEGGRKKNKGATSDKDAATTQKRLNSLFSVAPSSFCARSLLPPFSFHSR